MLFMQPTQEFLGCSVFSAVSTLLLMACQVVQCSILKCNHTQEPSGLLMKRSAKNMALGELVFNKAKGPHIFTLSCLLMLLLRTIMDFRFG